MKFEVSPHAQYRFLERGVSMDNIKQVILRPSSTRLRHGGRIEATKNINGRDITVIYIKQNGKLFIITVI
jgi:hypothetical protein